jgi:hypothetical protein
MILQFIWILRFLSDEVCECQVKHCCAKGQYLRSDGFHYKLLRLFGWLYYQILFFLCICYGSAMVMPSQATTREWGRWHGVWKVSQQQWLSWMAVFKSSRRLFGYLFIYHFIPRFYFCFLLFGSRLEEIERMLFCSIYSNRSSYTCNIVVEGKAELNIEL